jgi:serine/threonine-protein kinase
MGMVYRAHHLALNEDVAIKMLRDAAAADEEAVARFLREAQSAAKLKSEHVARVSDVSDQDGTPFMVMEYLYGADLGALVEQNGPMWPGIAVDLLLQACDAISEAHSLGIVHRDIKPGNLFVSFRPDDTAIVKVLDFGISKSANNLDMSLTQTQSVLGSPAYMSPEQMRSARSVDARSDIWSLGTVLYEIVEGRRPFQADSFSEMCVMVAADPPAPMTHAPELSAVIHRCLEKRPEARYANVAELVRDLLPFAQSPDSARFYLTRAQRVLGLAFATDQTPIPRPLSSYGSAPVLPTPLALSLLTTHGHRTQNEPTPAFANPTAPLTTPRIDTSASAPRSRKPVIIGALIGTLAAAAIAVALIANHADHASATPTPDERPVILQSQEVAPSHILTPTTVTQPATPPDASIADVTPVADPSPPTHKPVRSTRSHKPPVATATGKPPKPAEANVAKPAADPFSTANPGKPPPACDPFASRTGCK